MKSFFVLLLAAGCSFGAAGQGFTYAEEYQNRIKSAGTIQPLSETPFGESVDLYTGGTSFSQTDVVLEGVGPAIRITRHSVKGDWNAVATAQYSGFGDWELEIPNLKTLVAGTARYGSTVGDWRTYDGAAQPSTQRCTYMSGAMWSPYTGYLGLHTGGVPSSMWWQGYQLEVGGSSQSVLIREPAAPAPTSGTYLGVTTAHWQVGCLPATTNEQPGEGFLVLAPDGTKYYLTHLVYEEYSEFRDTDPYAPGYWSIQPRNIARMRVTRIEDKFGNYLTYVYNGNKLVSITASDGRVVTIAWSPTAPRIQSVSTNTGRTWTYTYTTGGTLAAVTAPDNSGWSFSGTAASLAFQPVTMSHCIGGGDGNPYPRSATGITSTYSITGPSGVTGYFKYSGRLRAQSYLPSVCLSYSPGTDGSETANPYFYVNALVQRSVSGPGMSGTWTYDYEVAKPSMDRNCAGNTCQSTTYTDVTEPDGTLTRYLHSTRYGALQGKLLRVETYENASILKRSEDRLYNFTEADKPYPAAFGSSLGTASPSYGVENLVSLRKSTVKQEGRDYVWEVPSTCGGGTTACFDGFGRPTKVVKSSSPSP